MPPASGSVLAINAGSSSIKFAVYEAGHTSAPALHGKLDRIGSEHSTLSWRARAESAEREIDASDAGDAVGFALDWLDGTRVLRSIDVVGHRLVHGGARTEAVRITPAVLAELHAAVSYAPEHLPSQIELIEALAARHPGLPQVACFDTAFHRSMPMVAKLLPIPRRYYRSGIQRYGFHGLSYAYLLDELERAAGRDAAHGRVVLAHLGHGASLAAVRGGKSIDTSMGFTPAAGVVMSTRSGDLDPGLVSFLANSERMTTDEFDRMVNRESGLLGVSERSADMRDLLTYEATDSQAAEAVALFCYQARKWLGAFAAALGGLDTLVFSAGIGERNALIRSRICEGLAFLGIELDGRRNVEHAPVISAAGSRVTVRVIPTDEERMIARFTLQVLGSTPHTGT